MPPRSTISRPIQEQVRKRAKFLCEYCHTSEQWQYVPFTVDHIVPVDLGGNHGIENFALACFHCNRHKSNKISAIDPISGDIVNLFNPRDQDWSKHFIWTSDCLQIVGLTPIGRATADLLTFNRERIIRIRSADL